MILGPSRLSNNGLVNANCRLLSASHSDVKIFKNEKMTCLFETNRSGLSYDIKEPLKMIFMSHETDDVGGRVGSTNNNQPSKINGVIRNMHVGSDPCEDIGLRINERIQKWLVREGIRKKMFNDRPTSMEGSGQLKIIGSTAKFQDKVNCHVKSIKNQIESYSG